MTRFLLALVLLSLATGAAPARDAPAAPSPVIRLPLSDGWTRRPLEEPPMHALIGIALGASLQANAARALQILEGTPLPEPTRAEALYIDCMRKRFGFAGEQPQDAIRDPFAAEVARDFRAYWRQALLFPEDRQAAESLLAYRLAKLVDAPEGLSLDRFEPLIIARLQQGGYDALMGRTSPLRDLLLWRKYSLRRFHVALPEGEHSVQVSILDDFAVMGWTDYATCGLRGAGGWTRGNMLFAVRPRFTDLRGEDFMVTFLGHETQHLADIERFPKLEPWHLEYRAKLSELTLATRTRGRIISKFLEDQGDDPLSPHGYANKRVLAALHARLGEDMDLASVPVAEMQEAARALVLEDTRDLANR